MGGSRRGWVAATIVAVIVVAAATAVFVAPRPPRAIRTVETVGIVSGEVVDGEAWLVRLEDGREVRIPYQN